MTITYRVQKEDFLAVLLFNASNSKRIQKRKLYAWILISIGFATAAFIFYRRDDNFLTITYGIVALVTALFYPTYFNNRYKRHYTKHVDESYANRFGREETLEIQSEAILFKNSIAEGSMKINAITKVDETAQHFFVRVSSGETLGIPKKELTTIEALREKFKSLGIPVYDKTNWKW
ncbi:MAG: YcxB family protein [Bacteroidota bacterium]